MIKIHYDKYSKQWVVLDSDGWSLLWYDKPSQARKARHLYKAYLTVKTDKEAKAIIQMIKEIW